MKTLLKIMGAALAVVAVCFVAFVVSEEMSDTEYFASQAGMSIRQCIDVAKAYGLTYQAADEMCSRRVPKKR